MTPASGWPIVAAIGVIPGLEATRRIVQLPAGRLAGRAERIAFRQGLDGLNTGKPQLRVIGGGQVAAFCAACAAPIDFGAVWRGVEAFCSVECSLGGDRPA